MARKRPISQKRRRHLPMPKPGSAPGLLQQDPNSLPTQIHIIGYGPEGYQQTECSTLEEMELVLEAWPMAWVHVVGLSNIKLIEQLGEYFNIDRLLLEDVLDSDHRPKVEFLEHSVFTILKSAVAAEHFESEQISLFLKKNMVLVFKERPSQVFEQVRERIRRGTGKIRHSSIDYLYYALIDEVIDHYFPVLEGINRKLASIEEQMIGSQERQGDIIPQIHHVKSDLLLLHRAIWPIADITGQLMRDESGFVTKSVRSYLRDCYDHAMQGNELTQYYRDTTAGLLNTFLAYEGHKTNEAIKVLTIISAVFIPLNLIAGIYGMNFKYMPELEWIEGYPFALALMIIVALGMYRFIHRRGWIEN